VEISLLHRLVEKVDTSPVISRSLQERRFTSRSADKAHPLPLQMVCYQIAHLQPDLSAAVAVLITMVVAVRLVVAPLTYVLEEQLFQIE
jgi:hypothetical protein